ncbi:MAG TPA: VOC family protein, partial [Steroidobacteraceae bacterium]|nr:VOC family protein [Steroidobacteraceae bacterium]
AERGRQGSLLPVRRPRRLMGRRTDGLGTAPLRPVQIAYHVPDPAAVAVRFARELGWGPFYLMEHIPLDTCLYRGRPAAFDHTSAYGQAGDLMVELITQHDDNPSVLRDVFAAGETGVHHVACFVPDLQAALNDFRAKGYAIALEASTRGTSFAMVDAVSSVGHMLELYEPGAGLRRFYDFVKRQAQGWDGVNAVRRLAP